MKTNAKVAVIDYSELKWRGSYSGEGEPRRLKFYCDSMPEALFWLFGGRELGELERVIYGWAGGGCPDKMEISGKFLKTNDGWLEDLSVTLADAPVDRVGQVDGEAGEREAAYAQDILLFLGLSR
jgi:hypothetical protein